MHPNTAQTSSSRIRILIIISDLSGGGAERVVSTILQELDRERFEPVLALWRDTTVYPVPPDVPAHILGKHRAWDLPRTVYRTRKLIERLRPDVVYSHLSYVNFATGMALMGLGNRPLWVACEHNNPYLSLPRSMRIILRWSYRSADVLIGVSKGVSRSVREAFSLPEGKVVTVYNPLELPEYIPRNHLPSPGEVRPVTLVAMGRLTEQKDYPTMLRAIGLLRKQTPVRLRILGEGPLRSDLEELSASLNISDCVEFLGFVSDPFPVIRDSDVYVMSSLWEGLPTALIEAMACGVPVVSTRAEYGPEEIIMPGESGLLVDIGDSRALAHAIGRILFEDNLRVQLALNGSHRVRFLFAKDVQIPFLEKVLIEALGK